MGAAKVITMCHSSRPEYTRRSMEALARCDGIGEYTVIACVDARRSEDSHRVMEELFDRRNNGALRLVVTTFAAVGVNLNTLFALDAGFQRTDFVIHVEDDILLAPDALRFFEYCAQRYKDDPEVFSVTAYNRVRECPPAERWHTVERRAWFHGWGWGTWRDRHEEFKDGLAHSGGETWDVHLHKRVMNRERPRVEVYPALSRSQNIGARSSIHHFTPEWHAAHQHVPHFAGDLSVSEGSWSEAQGGS